MAEEQTIYTALVDAVKACGGSKHVAAMLWPAKANHNLEAARRHLANCLNPECAEKLSLVELMLIVRTARLKGDHTVMEYLAKELSYTPPQPVEPQDEADDLRRQFIESTRALAAMADRIEKLEQASRSVAPKVRAAA